jgi:hypothetical protein
MSGFSTGEYNSAKYKLLYALNNTRILPIDSDPTNEDTDGDNCSDYDEKNIFKTSPLFNEVEDFDNKMKNKTGLSYRDEIRNVTRKVGVGDVSRTNSSFGNCYALTIGVTSTSGGYNPSYLGSSTDPEVMIAGIRYDIGYFNVIELTSINSNIPTNFNLAAFKVGSNDKNSYHIMVREGDYWYDAQPKTMGENVVNHYDYDGYVNGEVWRSSSQTFEGDTQYIAIRKDWYNHV